MYHAISLFFLKVVLCVYLHFDMTRRTGFSYSAEDGPPPPSASPPLLRDGHSIGSVIIVVMVLVL